MYTVYSDLCGSCGVPAGPGPDQHRRHTHTDHMSKSEVESLLHAATVDSAHTTAAVDVQILPITHGSTHTSVRRRTRANTGKGMWPRRNEFSYRSRPLLPLPATHTPAEADDDGGAAAGAWVCGGRTGCGGPCGG